MKHDKRSLAKRLVDIRLEYQGRDWQSDEFTDEIKQLLKIYPELEYVSFIMDEFKGFQKIDKLCYSLYKKYYSHHFETNIEVQEFFSQYEGRFRCL